MHRVQIGIIGFGTVGSGTAEVLLKNRDLIRGRSGVDIHIKVIADLNLRWDRGLNLEGIRLTEEAMEIVEDPEIQIVVELIGGLTTAKEYVTEAIRRGKHVVTANKALLAHYGEELFSLAQRHNVLIGFEASVGGGIPIITAIQTGLTGNRITKLMAILNGTSNYILTRMRSELLPYQEVVEEAVRLGFAEDPPTLDVDGTDVAHKLVILMALFYGMWFPLEEIYREGIQEIT
ncbi:MAG: homoserine dehydrogenase, partial [Desulfatiglandales bacterium]